MTRRSHEAGRHGRGSPPLAPSQGSEQETTSAGMRGRRHEAVRRGRDSPPLAPSQGREQETTIAVPAGSGPRIGTGTTESEECIRSGRPSEGSPVNSFPRVELGAPP